MLHKCGHTKGADTIVWLACSKNALENNNGLFYQDREGVSTHLPFGQTKSSQEDCEKFMLKLNALSPELFG